MTALRNIAGKWIIRYKRVTYYTGTHDIRAAIDHALMWNGEQPDYMSM